MNVNCKIDFGRIGLIVVLLVMCMIFSVAAQAQNNSVKKLNADEVTALLVEMQNKLKGVFTFDAHIDEIVEKWNAREDLVGKTREQILPLLFSDVILFVPDAVSRRLVWNAWNPTAAQGSVKDPPGINDDDFHLVLSDLHAGLKDPIKNDDLIYAISDKWNARTDLAGKTRLEIMRLAFADVQSVIKDPATRTKIWNAWTASLAAATAAQAPAKAAAAQTPQGLGEKDATSLMQILGRADDNWTRPGWTPEMAANAIAVNNLFTSSSNKTMSDKFTSPQRALAVLNILKLALTPASFDQFKKLSAVLRSLPRLNEPVVGTIPDGNKNVEITVPFKQVPNAKTYLQCKAQEKRSITLECGRAMVTVIPYQERWGRINLSCLSDPSLLPVANELIALTKAYPVVPGLITDSFFKSHFDPRGVVCNSLVKNEMAKDMARDGFPLAIVDPVIQEPLNEDWPPITSVNFGGKVEKVSDQDAIMDWFRQRKLAARIDEMAGSGSLHGGQSIGSVHRLKEDEPKEAYRARVEAMLRSSIDPGSGRRFDDSLIVFRLKSTDTSEPNEITAYSTELRLNSKAHLYDSYDNGFDLTDENSTEVYVLFTVKLRPGQPVPDKRDLAIAAYGWIIGMAESESSEHLGFVMRRWVMYNIHTGEIYGTSEKNGDGKNYGQLFRLDH